MRYVVWDGSLADIYPAQATLSAGTNTVDFTEICTDFTLQNNTAADIKVSWDGMVTALSANTRRSSAVAGDLVVSPGQTLSRQVKIKKLFLFVTGAPVLNGTAAGGIVVFGGRGPLANALP